MAATAIAVPVYDNAETHTNSAEHIPILRDDRVHEDGHYSTDVETANGIVASEAGQPTGSDEAVAASGYYSLVFSRMFFVKRENVKKNYKSFKI